jgi:hypothetical protein
LVVAAGPRHQELTHHSLVLQHQLAEVEEEDIHKEELEQVVVQAAVELQVHQLPQADQGLQAKVIMVVEAIQIQALHSVVVAAAVLVREGQLNHLLVPVVTVYKARLQDQLFTVQVVVVRQALIVD